MKLSHLLTATAAVALMGGAAFAQETADPAAAGSPVDQPGATTNLPDSEQSPDASAPAPMDADATSPDSTGPTVGVPAATQNAMDAAASTPSTTPSGAPVTVNMVTNGPVADTPENRELYTPLSNAGKHTKAAGN